MQGITLGDIHNVLTFIASLLGAGASVSVVLKKYLGKALSKTMEPTNTRLDALGARLSAVELSNCKNYLVQTISKLDNGSTCDKIEIQRFWEEYDIYTKAGGNSYIHSAVERLQKEGKL